MTIKVTFDLLSTDKEVKAIIDNLNAESLELFNNQLQDDITRIFEIHEIGIVKSVELETGD